LGVINLNLSQASLKKLGCRRKNDCYEAFTSYINYFFIYREGKKSWDNSIDFNFGYVQTTNPGNKTMTD